MTEIQEEEIDLREYINVLLKRKGIIILIFLIAVITAALVSYFVLKPVYEANVVITVSAPKVEDSLVYEISLEDYKYLIKDIEIEEELIQKLNLNIPPIELTPNDLDQMLTVELVELPKGTSLIKMNLHASEPKLTKDIINTWVTLFVEKNRRLYFDEVKRAKTDVEEKLKLAEQEFYEIEEKLMKFNGSSRLIDIQFSLEKEKAKKEQIIKALNEQEKILKLNKSIAVDQFFQQLISNITDNNLTIDNLTYISEETNPFYFSLTEQLISTDILINSLIAEKDQLEKNINDFNQSLGNLKKNQLKRN